MGRKIHFGMMCQNNLWELIPNLEKVIPHVDSVTLIDGGSTDDTIIYMRNWSRVEPKIRFYIYPWKDDFPAQRNNYVKHIGEIAKPGDWVLTADPDEFFDTLALTKLHAAADRAEKDGKNMVGFQCRSISLQGGKRVWENLDEYWKQLYFKWDPNFHYTGHKCHEGKGGVPHAIMNTGLIYEHVKQENVIWVRGMRNSLVGGSGDNLGTSCPNYVKVRAILDGLSIGGWHELYKYMLAGNVAPELKAFMEEMVFEGTPKASDYCWKKSDWAGSSEWREWYKAYFRILHPEEETKYCDIPNLDDSEFLGRV